MVVEDDLRARARAFVDALAARHADFDVLFASKAFPCTAVYRVLAEEGLACDVASGGELALALSAGFDAARTYMHGNAKSAAELREALAAGVGHIVLDSPPTSIERLAAHRRRARRAVRTCCIRVTPGVAGDTHQAISTGQADSKFGFSLDQAREAIAALAGHPVAGPRSACTSTSAPSCSSSSRSGQRSGRSPSLGDFPVYNLGGGLGAAYTARPAAAQPRASTSRRSSTRSTPSSAPASACCSSPGARWSPTRR